MAAEQIVTHFEGVSRTGDGSWMAKCPCHEDQKASLSIARGKDDIGRTVMFCHAGCQTNEILRAVNLEMTDLMGDEPNGHGVRNGHSGKANGSKIVSTYDYRDESGELLFQALRMEPKDFRQRRPNGKGGWLWNLKDVRTVPYRLPELLASDKKAPIYLVEGEKDAHTLASRGRVATTNAGGAGKFRAEHAQFLAGRHVVLIPDNDEPGREHVRKAAEHLSGVAASIRILSLPDLPAKGDVTDWFQAGNTVQQLDELVSRCEHWKPATLPSKDTVRSYLKLTRLSDIQPRSIYWGWVNVFAFGKLSLVVGDPGQSKSLLTVDIGARFTRGSSWPDGSECGAPGTVIYMNAEDDPEDTLRPRFDAAGGDPERAVFLEATVTEQVKEGKKTERQFHLQRDIDVLEETIKAIEGPVLVSIDPLSNYLAGSDTHKDGEVRAALMPLVEVLRKTGAAAIGVCHLNKSAASGALYRVGGSIGFVGVARSVWAVTRDPDDRQSSRRLFIPIKANLAPDSGGYAYEIKSTVTGCPFLAWEADPVSISATDALSPEQPQQRERESPQQDAAKEWLEDCLSEGPIPSADVYKRASQDGHSKRTIDRAKDSLNVIVEKSGFQGKWQMRLPKETQRTATSEERGSL